MKSIKENRNSISWRRAAVAVIPAALLLATVFLTRDAQPVRAASPDAAKARNRAECVSKNAIAQKAAVSMVKKGLPAPTLIRVKHLWEMADLESELMAAGDIQWCWGQSCVHVAWYCPDPYDARDLGPCTIACCEGSNCGPSVTCDDKPHMD